MATGQTRRGGARILAAALGLAAGSLAATGESADVMVYSARAHYGQEPAMEAFTKKTGIVVKSFGGESGPLFERLKAEGDKTPADVLISVDAGNLWNAARAGLLGKVDSPEILANIPAHLRDPENRWVGLTVRARTIMYNTKKVKPEELSTYEALGDPKWKGRLCLRSSTHIYNQSLLATMIKRYGEAKAESIVKGWVANNPTLIQGDTKVLEAVAAGQCDVALTNTYYLGRILAKDALYPRRLQLLDEQRRGQTQLLGELRNVDLRHSLCLVCRPLQELAASANHGARAAMISCFARSASSPVSSTRSSAA